MSNILSEQHISFEQMVDFVFSDDLPKDFLSVAAKINHHLYVCPECKKLYNDLVVLKEQRDIIAENMYESEKNNARVLKVLQSVDKSLPFSKILEQCNRFTEWVSFIVNGEQGLKLDSTGDFSHPKLVAVMKSSDNKKEEETESEIKSSIYDETNNRISVGVDGVLTIYFKMAEHPEGKRIILLPDNMDDSAQIQTLLYYDETYTYVRFENIESGQYTIMVES